MNRSNKIAEFFLRNGCYRFPNPKRVKEGHRVYKKGTEARFTAMNESEVEAITKLLTISGIRYGKPYKKVNRTIIPVYSSNAVAEIKKMVRRFQKNNL